MRILSQILSTSRHIALAGILGCFAFANNAQSIDDVELPPTEFPPTEFPPTELPPTELPPTELPPTELPPTQLPLVAAPSIEAIPAIQSTVNSAVTSANNALEPPVNANQQHVFTINPLDISATDNTLVRVLNMPATCVPEANSLDCSDSENKSGGGANVADQVRSGVIGEVGQGRAATEGAHGAQRQEACTPVPGQLTCAP